MNRPTTRTAHTLKRLVLALLMTLALTNVTADSVLLTEAQIQAIDKKYGNQAGKRLQAWQKLIISHRKSPEMEKVRVVNRFFNRMRFIDDIDHWKVRDYWATPVEFLATRGGDCEDFSIAKYFTLTEMGVPASKLRITYVKALEINQAHMVLAYYPTPEAEPLILDNLKPRVLPAGKRPDLVPVYSFNGDNLWLAKELRGRGKLVGSSSRISLWRRVIRKIREEKNLKKSPIETGETESDE